MSAAEDRIHERAAQLSAECRQPFAASRKIFVEIPQGGRVPMREISLSPTRSDAGTLRRAISRSASLPRSGQD